MKKTQNAVGELRKKSREDLISERKKLDMDLAKIRVAHTLQKEKNSSLIKSLRRSIARIETLLSEKVNNG